MTINFNTEPYYDDYDEDKKFYKILFKPGVSVQARELTQLQTIIQAQVERHGSHIFKDGAKVTGGEFGYTNKFHGVKLQPSNNNILLKDNIDQFVEKEVRGVESGVVARVVMATPQNQNDDDMLFVTYTSAGRESGQTRFKAGEKLVSNEIINGVLPGNTIATVVDVDHLTTGSSASIERGVFYIKGHFVLVEAQRLILSKYYNNPSVRIGLQVKEDIVTADDDSSLLDVAQNSPNFSARGADRYAISLSLSARSLEAAEDADFIEIERVVNGVQQGKVNTSPYSELEKSLATRTFDESGDYVVKPFQLKIKESLNDGANGGVYQTGTTTDQGNTPSDDLMTLQISAGRAYVKGYQIYTNSPSYIDVEKPRNYASIEGSTSVVDVGNYVLATNIVGMPDLVSENNDVTSLKGVELRDRNGSLIGVSRIRTMEYHSGDEGNTVDNLNDQIFKLFLFDVKMFTNLTVTGSLADFPVGTMVRGSDSKATGYVYGNNGSDTLYLTSVSGTFKAETVESSYTNFTTSATIASNDDITSHAFEFVKSVFMEDDSDYAADFSADLVLESSYTLTGLTNVSGTTITGLNARYDDELTIGDTIQLPTGANGAIETRTITARINNNQYTINSAVTTDSNSITIARRRAFINEQEKNLLIRRTSKDYTRSVVHRDSIVRMQFIAQIGTGGVINISTNAGTFTDVENDDFQVAIVSGTGKGNVINLKNSNNVSITGEATGALQIVAGNVLPDSGYAKINATVKVANAAEKAKTFRKASIVDVSNKSGETTGVVYGTSAHHKDISLGVADAVRVLAVYDSGEAGTAATIPSLTVASTSGTFQRGEIVKGLSSGATALLLDIVSPMRYVSQNGVAFSAGEQIQGFSSAAEAEVVSSNTGSANILSRYLLDSGQRDNYYDIAKLQLKTNQALPKGDLAVIFDYFEHGSGDFFTVDSYDVEYSDIPTYSATRIDPEIRNPNGIYDLRSSIDFRPRVGDATRTDSTRIGGAKVVTGTSFDFQSRGFESTSASKVFIPKDSSSFDYDITYYLARRDALFLTADGRFKLVKGTAAESPRTVADIDNAMRVADITMDPYVLNVADVAIKKTTNKRFTMKDIGLLEQRVNSIEYYTSMSLLEVSAQNLQIQDANGLDRFKSGFLVDNFGGHKTGDVLNRDYRCAIDMQNRTLRPKYYMKNIKLEEKDQSFETRLASNYRNTGGMVTLPYIDVKTIEQPYATRVENLNPVLNFSWTGTMTLEPSADEWFEINRLPDLVSNVEGNFDTIVAQNQNAIGTIWSAPVTEWTGVLVNEQQSTRKETRFIDLGQERGRAVLTRTTADELGIQSRTGLETLVVEQIDITSDGDRLLSSELIEYIRPNQIYFAARGMKPNTRVYPFFDKQNVTNYVQPVGGSFTTEDDIVAEEYEVEPVWDKVGAVMISFDHNTTGSIDIELRKNDDVMAAGSWSSGLDEEFTFDFATSIAPNVSGGGSGHSTSSGSSSGSSSDWDGTVVTTGWVYGSDGFPLTDSSGNEIWSGSSSSSGSSKIVCTAMNDAYGFGSFRQKIWLAQSRDLPAEYQLGYHTLFMPLVNYAYNTTKPGHMALRKVLEHIARHRTADIWKQKRGKRDRIGQIERAVLEPLCYITGVIVKKFKGDSK